MVEAVLKGLTVCTRRSSARYGRWRLRGRSASNTTLPASAHVFPTNFARHRMVRDLRASLGTQALAFLGAVVGVTGALALLGLVLWLGYSGVLPWRRPSGPWSGMIDMGWLLLFSVQHSGMVRVSFKHWCRNLLPVAWE